MKSFTISLIDGLGDAVSITQAVDKLKMAPSRLKKFAKTK